MSLTGATLYTQFSSGIIINQFVISEKYNMSFTAGALFQKESVSIAQLYLEIGGWTYLRKDVVDKNLLQTRTISSAKRSCREICLRLEHLSPDELELLVGGDPYEQKYLLWLAICRQHAFLYEFSVEVIRERFLTLRYDLHHEDFDAFFNEKLDWHEELEKITTMTRNKLRQVVFRMLREAELLNTSNAIISAMLSPRLFDLLSRTASQDLLIFPMLETIPRSAINEN